MVLMQCVTDGSSLLRVELSACGVCAEPFVGLCYPVPTSVLSPVWTISVSAVPHVNARDSVPQPESQQQAYDRGNSQ